MLTSKKLTFYFFIFLFSGKTFALSSDRNKPIKIKADSVTINEKTGISIYLGNVVFTQGSLVLKGSKVVLHQPDGDVKKIIVTGKPATFRQMQDNKPEPIEAEAGKLKYSTEDERVYLTNNASIAQGDNLLKGNKIEYNTRDSTVTAQKGLDNNNRVNVILEPNKP